MKNGSGNKIDKKLLIIIIEIYSGTLIYSHLKHICSIKFNMHVKK